MGMNYYEELGIPRTASEPEIRRAYKQLAKLLHPDQYPDEQLSSMADRQMRRLNGILEVLTDPVRRLEYDAGLDAASGLHAPKRPDRSDAVSGVLPRVLRSWLEPANRVFLLGIAIVVGLAWWFGVNTGKTEGEHAAHVMPAVRSAAPERTSEGPVRTSVPAPKATMTEEQNRKGAASGLPRIEPRRPLGETPRPQVRPAEPVPQAATEQRSEPEPRGPDPKAMHPSDSTAALPPAQPARDMSPSRRFAGKWLYVPPSARAGRQDLYPPEYIELTIDEQAGVLRGRYKARYRVADKAISPFVSFQFEGRAEAAGASFPWTGPGGAAGQVTLKLSSESALHVSWSADRLGELGLVSGEATLVRKQE